MQKGLLSVLLLVGASAQPPRAPAIVSVPGRANANVSLAAHGTVVAAVWGASLPSGVTDIYAAVSRDNGDTFSAPVRVNAMAGDARVNGEQPPRVAVLERSSGAPAVVVAWTSKRDANGAIVSARSDDGGKTFGPTAPIAGGEAPGNRGWENLSVDSAGKVRVVWLDHRELAQSGAMAHTEGHHTAPAESKKDAVATAQLSKIYTATIGDRASARAITGGVCYCCKTAIATGASNDIYLAWRHVYPDNVRDIAFTVSRDAGQTFAVPMRVSDDRWQIEGCPEDGPALAVDSARRVHIVWPTLVNDGPGGQASIGIFYASSVSGTSFGARQRVPTEGVPHHPMITTVKGALVLAWDELKNGARQVVVANRPLGAPPAAAWTRHVMSADGPGAYPKTIAAANGRLVIAWTRTGEHSVVRIDTLQF